MRPSYIYLSPLSCLHGVLHLESRMRPSYIYLSRSSLVYMGYISYHACDLATTGCLVAFLYT
ncbi:hypothetical protein F383_30603 [Gossypium arboreum]|uniref:Uncharacterized protein n=1 Tax=Gossypium arboreum TaxID=29729 RepID=A0A0B0PEG6_GOSAR|nr:hypothetical protein F383_13994 [Gossypium arboreum]KHG13470.1 hypothetical protein F383_19877 [Gossypium arboreum]KHG14279.1 hypothetical protein F383_03791 [Gossypium arboreum]KHG18846.1 hypothetical protein F383_25719 [Gossypium arboreum]KHG23345.1 hypothetical protein F383_05683 [Gossypium arboreum]